RVSMVALVLKEKNPTAKNIIADPKPKFSKMALFQEGWGNHFDGMIDWVGSDFGGDNVEVNPDVMTVSIDGEVTKVDVCNVIPAMK
ncbi:NAD(P)/FAD-dependent oxidoreductase, partial [Shimia thalassica]|nr:NAD(P)/FAD-dependent oxidoreductase [Shimia thalassica]